ncbi:glycosyltransferase family 4 protein [Actimicrobium sp. CCI2.3]|uniref:glycosyltransferase family 4 protein n=1 Tax=Actimicrobium sp. CCI2.3 TaxID=3048616 RepID=UPI002AB34E43|nr:glycosyltransferase family 4 protein [Actimicrobium sp. CCI2.3]MDY7576652.1 glycosyltransferase family 4 protein [Actimicrobium sp. CCI2.3]MEB0021253.1 glycosyltransferase family 4 protein [Actimicrobium sp. CCI2.3]
MTIKVTHIVRQYAPSVGGMEDVVQNIARQQIEHHGQIPTIVTLDRVFTRPTEVLPHNETIDGVNVIRLPFKGSSRYPLAPGVLKQLAGADVVHVHGVDFFYDYLALTKYIHRRPLVASTHGGFFHTEFASTLKKVYFNTMTRASSLAYDRVIGTSNNDADLFKSVVAKSKLCVIENGVNVEKYSGKASAQLSPVAIYFGRWSSNKGLIETIELFSQLVTADPTWQLIIAGREYDFSHEDLLALVNKYQLAANIQIVPNPSEQDLAALIGKASYYICLSRHEGFGIAPIEAMSAGLIPILSDIPPFRKLVTQSGLGILLTVTNLPLCVKQVAELHQQVMASFAEKRSAVQRFVKRYSWNDIAERYVDIYKDIVRSRTNNG